MSMAINGASRKLELPPGGSADIVSANDYGPEAHFSFESYLIAADALCL